MGNLVCYHSILVLDPKQTTMIAVLIRVGNCMKKIDSISVRPSQTNGYVYLKMFLEKLIPCG